MAKTPKLKIPKDYNGFGLAEDAALKRKRHSALIADAIHRATILDVQFGATLAFLLGIEATPALAMYESVRNATAQVDAVRAATKAVLGEEDAKLFADIIKLSTQAQKDRHRFAHWLWGYYPNNPAKRDVIVMIEPEMGLYAWQAMASVGHITNILDDGPRDTPKLRAPIQIKEYNLEALKGVAAKLMEVYECLFFFQLYAHLMRSGDATGGAQVRQLLLAQPAIAELHKSQEMNRRNSTKSNKRPPPQSRKRSPQKPQKG